MDSNELSFYLYLLLSYDLKIMRKILTLPLGIFSRYYLRKSHADKKFEKLCVYVNVNIFLNVGILFGAFEYAN